MAIHNQTKMHVYAMILLLGSIFTSLPYAKSAKILAIFPILAKSHQNINQPIVKGLAARGHEITMITPFKSSHAVPNYTEILLSEGLQNFVDGIAIEDSAILAGVENFIKFIHALESSSCDKVLGLEYIKQLINSKVKTIDLIIVEIYHTQCYHLLAHKLNVPLILVVPTSLGIGLDYFVGNPNNPSITPVDMSWFTTKMDFFQRLENTFHRVVHYLYQIYVANRDMEKYAREVFHMELPSNEELNKRTALAFYNNHFSFISRPKSPNAIDISGIHIKEPKKLPKDIEDFIEGSVHGVIVFSFGSGIKVSSIPSKKLKDIKDALSAIPQRVLWRVNDLNIGDVSSNVKLSKWLPQRDILEHKNVIAFISHCGLFGTLEAIHTSTPVIGIPFSFDQYQNANMFVEHGAGIHLDYATIDKNILLDALNKITADKKYRENISRWSNIFKDRPVSPLDEAFYWTEYVLKHNGATHLRTAGADMHLYQYLLLDVLLLSLSIVVGITYFCKFLFKIIISGLHCKTLKKNKVE